MIVPCNDQNPPYFGQKVKAKIKMENRVYKEYMKNGGHAVTFCLLQNL